MYSKFPFSLENIPRQKSFACFSLRIGCLVSGLIVILSSILVLAACASVLITYPADQDKPDSWTAICAVTVFVAASNFVTLFLSALMLVGVLKEKPHLIRPWVVWTSLQVIVNTLLFVTWSTMNMINHFNNTFLIDFLIQFLILLVRFYMLMIVGSYYKQLVEEKGENERLVKLMNTENWYSV